MCYVRGASVTLSWSLHLTWGACRNTKLFGRKKASDEDNAGSDHDESEIRKRKQLPKQYAEHLEELVERNPTIKPASALRNLKAALCLPHPLEHGKAITTKVSSLKRKLKVIEKAKHFFIAINGVHACACAILPK